MATQDITFRILPDLHVGRALACIEFVARAGKPIAEVGTYHLSESQDVSDLAADVEECIRLSGESVRAGLIEKAPKAWAIVFFAQPWVVRAFRFLYQASESDEMEDHRHWVAGLLFGYSSAEIQRFINAVCDAQAPMLRHDCNCDMVERFPHVTMRFHNRNTMMTAKCPRPGNGDQLYQSSAIPHPAS